MIWVILRMPVGANARVNGKLLVTASQLKSVIPPSWKVQHDPVHVGHKDENTGVK